jgi:hypothetical protein
MACSYQAAHELAGVQIMATALPCFGYSAEQHGGVKLHRITSKPWMRCTVRRNLLCITEFYFFIDLFNTQNTVNRRQVNLRVFDAKRGK